MVLIGVLFSYFEKPYRSETVFSSLYFWHGFVVTTLFSLVVWYAAVNFPDWMWMYFDVPQDLSWISLVYLFLFLYYFPYAFGFYFGYDLKKHSVMLWWIFAVAMLIFEFWLVSLFFDRYSVVGTKEEFLQGTAKSLMSFETPLALLMNLCFLVMILYYLLVFFYFKKTSRKTISLD